MEVIDVPFTAVEDLETEQVLWQPAGHPDRAAQLERIKAKS